MPVVLEKGKYGCIDALLEYPERTELPTTTLRINNLRLLEL